MARLRNELSKKLERIEELENRPSKIAGGSALFYRGKEIAHFHNNNEIDLRLTRKIIRQEKLNHPTDSKIHRHRTPSSEWIEIKFKKAEHIDEVLRLFKLAMEQY